MSGHGDTADLELLLVDGDNLLHALRGRRDEGATAWLLPRLARWRPESLRIIVVFDGHPAPSEPMRQRAFGIELVHAGSRSADDVIVEILADRPYAERSRSAVVTRDRDLAIRVHGARGQVRSPDWLLRGFGAAERPTGGRPANGPPGGIGRPRPPGARQPESAGGDEDVHQRWPPRRGATRRRGDAPRGARRTRRR